MAQVLPQFLFLAKPLDELETKCLVIPFFCDEKPLKGIAGMADWRLNGKISQQLIAKKIEGNVNETVLIPVSHRLCAQNLLLVGLGNQGELNEAAYHRFLSHIVQVLEKARLSDFVLAIHELCSAEDQVLWVASFLEKSSEVNHSNRNAGEGWANPLPDSWVFITNSKTLNTRLKKMKKQLAKQINCKFEAQPSEDFSPKSFALR